MQHVPRTTISRQMLLAAILIWTTDAAFAQTAAELQRAKAKCDEYRPQPNKGTYRSIDFSVSPCLSLLFTGWAAPNCPG